MNNSYQTKKLGEVCKVSSGGSAPQGDKYFSNGKYPFFRTADVGAVHLSDSLCSVKDYLNDEGIKKLKLFNKGTILFPKSGASTFLNHRVIMGCDGYVASHLATIWADTDIYSKYLYLFLSTINARDIAPNSAYPSLKLSDIEKIEIPLPPLPEQEKIVKKIEELFGKIDEAQKLREEAQADAAALIPATLHQIFEKGREKEWKEVFFGDEEFLSIIDGDRGKNYPKKSDFTSEGYCLFLNTSNVRKGNFNFIKCDFISKERDELLRKGRLERGDVVLTTRGTLGNSAYYDDSIPYERMRINSGMVLLRVIPTKLNQRYLMYILRSPDLIGKVIDANSGSAQPQLPIRVLSKISFLLPSLPEQKKIVAYLDSLSEKTNKLQEFQQQTVVDMKALKQSILHKAFEGELV